MGVLQNFLFGSIAIWTPVVPVAYSFWPKYSGGPDSIEVEIEPVSLDSQSNSDYLKPRIRAIKQRACWSLAKSVEKLREFSELIVCRDKDNPSKPNVYFYKLEQQEGIISDSVSDKRIQKAQKVVNLNFVENRELYEDLEIHLVGNQKEKMKLSETSKWFYARNLNPYRECKLIEAYGGETLLVCAFTRIGQSFFIPFKLNKVNTV